MVFDGPEIVTFGQVSVQSNISGNILSGIHRVASLTQAIDGGLVWGKVNKSNVSVSVISQMYKCVTAMI